MKKVLLLLFFTIYYIQGQTTFDLRFYKNTSGFNSVELSDGKIVTAAKYHNEEVSSLFLQLHEPDGQLIGIREFTSEFDSNFIRSKPLAKLNDGRLAFLTKSGGALYLNMLEDFSAEPEVNLLSDRHENIQENILFNSSEGNLITAFASGTGDIRDSLHILCLSPLLELVFSAGYSVEAPEEFVNKPYITEREGEYVFQYCDLFLRLSKTGELIDSIRQRSFVTVLVDDYFYLIHRFGLGLSLNLSKMNLEGEVLWDKRLPKVRIPRTFEKSADKKILIGGDYYDYYGISTIAEVDTSGEIIWRDSTSSSTQDILLLANGDILFTGKEHTNLVRTTSEGYYKGVGLILPKYQFFTDEATSIKVIRHNVDYVNIELSMDNGQTWELLADYFNGKTFKWTPEGETSDSCLFRVSETGNPLFSAANINIFEIIDFNRGVLFEPNGLSMWILNDGRGSFNPYIGDSGLFQKVYGTLIPMVFTDGFLFGMKVNSEIAANGGMYRGGLAPGKINEEGIPVYPYQSQNRVFKVKKDWSSMPPGKEREQYKKDHFEWPVELGAPWVDVNENGIYEPLIDHPEYVHNLAAFNVMNAADSLKSLLMLGSKNVGMELHQYVYDKSEFFNAIFKRYTLINKSDDTFEDVYISYWSDDDLGNANDDFMGFFKDLRTGYTYNGLSSDLLFGDRPPAIGHMILQGPLVESEGDTAIYKGKKIEGYKNLGLSSTIGITKSSSPFPDIPVGIAEGKQQLYNYMKGLDFEGNPIVNPVTGDTTTFALTGDPVEGTGWYDGAGWPPGHVPQDRRDIISSGPFNMAPGDTQEVIIAIFAGQGTDHLNSVTKLKEYAVNIINDHYGSNISDVKDNLIQPLEYKLEQNFPNPFNPTTTIRYQVKESGLVSLKVYDILGREVTELINKDQAAGTYEVKLDAMGLASGVYMYRLEASKYSSVKKMIYLK